jgi:hypothetical protein
MMGDLFLTTNQPVLALAEYEASLRANPNRFNSLYGAARSAELANIPNQAATYYRLLLEVSKSADGGRKELRYAKSFLASS